MQIIKRIRDWHRIRLATKETIKRIEKLTRTLEPLGIIITDEYKRFLHSYYKEIQKFADEAKENNLSKATTLELMSNIMIPELLNLLGLTIPGDWKPDI